MTLRQVGTQATKKTEGDPVTLAHNYGVHRGKFYPPKPKITVLLLLGHFQYFFTVSQPLNSLKCRCLLNR